MYSSYPSTDLLGPKARPSFQNILFITVTNPDTDKKTIKCNLPVRRC